jgi:hypothetical protein
MGKRFHPALLLSFIGHYSTMVGNHRRDSGHYVSHVANIARRIDCGDYSQVIGKLRHRGRINSYFDGVVAIRLQYANAAGDARLSLGNPAVHTKNPG